MEKFQEPLTVRDLDLELKMHHIFTEWSEAHKREYEGIGALPYNPARYPEQRIDRHMVESRVSSTRIPARVFAWGMGRQIVKTFRDPRAGQNFIKTFHTAPAYPEDAASLTEVLSEEYIDNGKSVALITDHADNLADIARVCGGLNSALAQRFGKKYMNSFGILVSKNMTRETYRGKRIVHSLSQIAEVHTVLPDTDSVEKYRKLASAKGNKVTEDEVKRISQKVTGGTARIIFRRIREGEKSGSDGLIEGIVPTGQGTIKLRGRDGQVRAQTVPSITETAAGLICRFHAVIPVSIMGDRYKIGHIAPVKDSPGYVNDGYANLVLVEDIMDGLAEQTQEIAGIPVHYQRLTPTGIGKTALYEKGSLPSN